MEEHTRTIKVTNLSDLATEKEVRDFFGFTGKIERILIRRESGALKKTAFVTFEETNPIGIALILSGATLMDRIITVSRVEDSEELEMEEVRMVENVVSVSGAEDISPSIEVKSGLSNSGRLYVSKAQVAVSNMIAKGSAIRQDAMTKAKAFDEKHQLTATASAKVVSFDRKVGLTEKLTVGISAVNEKVKSVDERLHVSDKTMAAILAAERKLNVTGSAVKSSRYVTTGTAWLNGAFTKVAKAGQVAGTKTREKFHSAVSNLTAKNPIPA